MKPKLINPRDVKPGDLYLGSGRINAHGLVPDTPAIIPYVITEVDERGFKCENDRKDEIRQEFNDMPGVIITQERPRCYVGIGAEVRRVAESLMYASERFLDSLEKLEKIR